MLSEMSDVGEWVGVRKMNLVTKHTEAFSEIRDPIPPIIYPDLFWAVDLVYRFEQARKHLLRLWLNTSSDRSLCSRESLQ